MVVSIQFSTVKKGQHGCHMCSVASFSHPTRRSRYASSVQLDAMASLLHEHHVRHNHLCPSSNYKCHCTSSLFTSTLCTGIKKKQQQRNEINKRDKQYSYKYVSLSSPPKHFWAIWRASPRIIGPATNWVFADPSTRNTVSDTDICPKSPASPMATRQYSGELTLLATWASRRTHTDKSLTSWPLKMFECTLCLANCKETRELDRASRLSSLISFTEVDLLTLVPTNRVAWTLHQRISREEII